MSFDQHLLPEETFAQYKQRILDPKSKTFCGAKWYYATVWLNTGQTTACHHPLPHQVDAIEVEKNPKLLSNTPRKKRERKEMQNGIQCKGCDYCWTVENLKTEKISDRVYKSVLYTDEDLQRAYESNPNEDFNLKYIEISFDRTCNFACSYCNPAFSTTWARDIKTHGGYKNIGSNGYDHYGHSHDDANRYTDDNNPYIKAFGEPLMSKHTWTLLDLMANEKSNVTYFAINTNLQSKPELINKLIEKANKIDSIHIYSSNESTGAQAEYIRDGLNWEQWQKNFTKISQSKVFSSMHSMCTINAIVLEGLVKYLDWCMAIKKQSNSKDGVTYTLNILRFPNFQSVLILPQEIRNKFAKDLYTWLDKNKTKDLLHLMEIEHTERLIEYLQNEKNTLNNRKELIPYFKNYYTQYDIRRKKDFYKTFPIIGEWLKNV